MKKLACAGLVVATPFAFLGYGNNTIDVKADVAGDLTYISEHVYNKLDANLTYENMGEEFDKFYAKIGKVKGEGDFSLGGITYGEENVKLSVGKKKFVDAPRFVVKENSLYVASYFLSLKAGNTENIDVKYGDTSFKVKVADGANLDANVDNVVANSNNAIEKVENAYNLTVNNSTALFKMTFKKGDEVVKPAKFITEQVNRKGNVTTISYGFTNEEIAGEGWLGFYAVGYGSNVASEFTRDYTIAPVGYKPVTVKLNITQVEQK